MAGEVHLTQEIRRLSEYLNRVLQDQVGAALTESVEHMIELARLRRGGQTWAEAELRRAILHLDEEGIGVVLRAVRILLDLMNMAEDRHRVRVLQDRERRSGDRPRPESIGAALERLSQQGFNPAQIQGFLAQLDIEPVFTAHPTEAKRRSVRSRLKAVQHCLQQMDNIDLLPRQQRRLEQDIHSHLISLWLTDPHRPERPTVLEEVKRALFFMETLWEVVPQLCRELEEGLERCFSGANFNAPNFLHFGSWIGGDRDGNPHVTAEVTANSLQMMRQAALEHHIGECNRVFNHLGISARLAGVSPLLKERIANALKCWPQIAERLERVSIYEPYRQWLRVIEWRLEQSLGAPLGHSVEGEYRRSADLEEDVVLLIESLLSHRAASVVESFVQDWLFRIRCFGLHLTRLDVRQISEHYHRVASDLMQAAGQCADYLSLNEADRCAQLEQPLHLAGVEEGGLKAETQEALALFRLLGRIAHQRGREVLGGHIISMTHQPSDILVVLWLASGVQTENEALGLGPAGLIPLFETIEDLAGAPATLERLLDNPQYAQFLQRQGGVQTVMIGYSDSTKDGGYLAASWAQYQAQTELHEVAERRKIRLVFFHGRGGSLGRGGGPAARSIMSLPAHTVGGALRITEQGEVLAARYDDPDIALRHLEQITAATFLVEAETGDAPKPQWLESVDWLAKRALVAYRDLVDTPGFVGFFEQTTPIGEIENLPIGSRPSRRRGERTLTNLRAIPWVFAWTQSRLLIPAWYGMGSAFEAFVAERDPGGKQLKELYRAWPYFRGAVDNGVLALAKADLYVARVYAQLDEDNNRGQGIWQRLEAEYQRTQAAMMQMMGTQSLLEDIPWLQRSIEGRNPFVEPLNLIQVELLRRLRDQDPDSAAADRWRDLVRLSIQGISAGMRTTG